MTQRVLEAFQPLGRHLPEGNYGDGTVMGWDIGTWENLGPEPHEGLKKGKLHFKLNGKKLKGEWALVKMHSPRTTKGNEWLLLKHGKAMKAISARKDDTSAISGRSLSQITKAHGKKWTTGKKASEKSGDSGPGTFKKRVARLAKKSSPVKRSPKKSKN